MENKFISIGDTTRDRLLQMIPSGVGIFDLDGDVLTTVYLNDGYFEMLGTTRGERASYFDEKKTAQAIYAEDIPAILKEAHASVRENRVFFCEFRVYRNDRTLKWLGIRANHVQLENGVSRFYAAYHDVDELKEAERTLAEERLRLKSMSGTTIAASCFNVTKDTEVEINAETFRYADQVSAGLEKEAEKAEPLLPKQNPSTKKILLSAAEAIPDLKQREEFIRMSSHAGMQKAFREGRKDQTIEYRRHTSQGLIWVSTRIVLLQNPETGDVLAFFYTRDINEQKVRQEVLSRLAMNEMDSAFYIDLQEQKLYSMEEAGGHAPAVSDFRGKIEEMIIRFVCPEDQAYCRREFDLAHILNALESQPIQNLYYRVAGDAEDGELRRKRMSIFYLNAEKRYLIFCRTDITEFYNMQLVQKTNLENAVRRAEEANHAKSDFLSRMSHDIRTPLNGILGMTSLALDESRDPAITGYLEKIEESGHFLLGLVNDILDMSKVEAGKMQLHPERYTFSEFRTYLASVIEPLCSSKDIHFLIRTGKESVPAIMADKLRINQIFFNLLSNAVKFTPKGGNVEFVISSGDEKDGRVRAVFLVRDSGIGMSKEFLKRIFQPFEQEVTKSDNLRSGSGLGLAIVRSLVDLMGGRISVQSELGKGSEFTVVLPLKVASGTEEKEKRQADEPGSLEGCHVLVAEDNAINREIILRQLEKKGIEATAAENGIEALEKFRASGLHAFDAVLMDVRMPSMDGLEATKQIRALEREDAKTVPIIAMTANAFDEDVRECLAAGMNAHLAKPAEPDALYRTLWKYIRKQT